jgi:tetratricopeptide (TPR) repeat protein
MQIVDLAEPGSDAALFAHRHLAEVCLEAHPWRAALHLRHVLKVDPDDDVVHALMGLCQALLGNYRAAVSAYRRALQAAPNTPWYHHNLGHLLDVALHSPSEAEKHLRAAHRLEPRHDEITASLAHCLARLGTLNEAKGLASRAVRQAPRNADHRALLRWIEDGAPDGKPGASVRRRGTGEAAQRKIIPDAAMSVRRAFETRMREAGFSARQVARARALWADFHGTRELRGKKPEVYAAAVEYAIACILGRRDATRAEVARRYGITPGSLSSRYVEIRDTLALQPNDPRYAG